MVEVAVVVWGLLVFLLINITFSTFTLTGVNGATDPTDASALKVMYNNLNSAPQLTCWSSYGDDPCGQSWKRVTCSGSTLTEMEQVPIELCECI